MKLSEVTQEDGKSCALLIKFLTNGRWDLSGNDAETLMRVRKWLHGVATDMASQLSAAPAPATEGFKVKSYTPAPTRSRKVRK